MQVSGAPLGWAPALLANNKPGANVIKLFTAEMYHYTMTLLSLCVIKQYNRGNYHIVAVNYHGKNLYNLFPWLQT